MSAKKPLVFVLPLTESLSKLKQAVEEVIDELDVEIFEVDEIMEINQLLPTIGQAVILFSSPKKCALSLQANKKFIHKLHSKVLLLSPTSLPRKTVDKFTKLGLTEFIPEPVNPKTLMFKVKMLINTIVIKEDNEEEEKVFSQNDTFTKTESTGEKQRVEKGILAEEDGDEEDIYAKDKKEKMLEITSDDDDTKKKNKYQEDSIATHWSSKKKASIELDNIEDDEEEKKKKRIEENSIDSYYKGNIKKDEVTLNFDEEDQKKKHNHSDDDEDIYKLKESTGLNIVSSDDEDEENIRRNLQLEIQDEKHKRKETDLYNDDENKKNEKNNKSLELEEESSHNNKKKQTELETEEDKSKNRKGFQDRIDDEYMSTKDSAQALQLEEDNDSKRNQTEDEIENENTKNKRERGFDLEDEENPNNAKKRNKELQLKDEKEKSNSLQEEEEKENKRKQDELLALDEDEEKSKKRATELTTLDDNDRNRDDEQNGLDLDALDDEQENQNKDKQLDVKANSEGENENSLDLEAEDDEQKNRHHSEIEDSEKKKKDKEKSLNLEDDDAHARKKKKELSELEFEKEKSNFLDKEKELNKKNKQGNGLNIEDEDSGPKVGKSNTEHIKTYMDSREGIKHKQYDWNLKKDEKGSSFDHDKKDKKNNVEINFKEKTDLGEQTIDYSQLKKEFEDISIYGDSGKKKKIGAQFIGDNNAETEKTNVLYPNDLFEKYDLPIPAENLQDDVVIDRFFKAESHGIEISLKILSRYEQRKNNFEDNITFIAEELFIRFGAHLEFYQTEHGQSSPKKIYSHYKESKLFDEDFLKNKEIELKNRLRDLNPFNIPTWKDDKFLTETNTFYFPYLEGVEKLGYALIDFPKGTNDLAKKEQGIVIETMIESLRGFVLDRYHGGNERLIEFEALKAKKAEEQEKGQSKDKTPQAKVLSFFNKWFKGKSA